MLASSTRCHAPATAGHHNWRGPLLPIPVRGATTSRFECAPNGHLGLTRPATAAAAALPLRRGRAARSSVEVKASHNYTPFPFNETEYQRVGLVRREPYGPLKVLPTQNGPCSGVLVFGRVMEQLSMETEVLEVFVAGDAAGNIYAALCGQRIDRPMAHDLLHQVITHGSVINRSELTLLKVAIVELKEEVFVGRLFFGDPATGRVVWDCDCRPSDGCYLHIKMGCPFYVSSAVWTAAAVPLSQSKVNLLAMAEMEAAMAASEHTQSASSTASYAQQQQQQPEHRAQHGHHSQQQPQAPPQQQPMQPPQHSNPPPLDAFRTPQQGQPHGVGIGPGSASSGQHAGAAHGNGNGKANGAQAANGTAGGSAVPAPPEQAMLVRAEDPEPIKLLKRKLQVALSEEDYRTAVSIRDHPYLDLHRKAHTARYFGHEAEARELEGQLRVLLRGNDASMAVSSGDLMD